MLGRQLERASRWAVGDVAAGRLVGEPLTDVSLRGPGPLSQHRRSDRPGTCHRLVQAQPVADVQQQPRDCRAEVENRLPGESLKPGFIDRSFVDCSHISLSVPPDQAGPMWTRSPSLRAERTEDIRTDYATDHGLAGIRADLR